MRIHSEGRIFVLSLGVVLLLVNGLIFLFFSSGLLSVSLPLSLILLAFFLQFFRNPKRTLPSDPKGIVSPADGKVVVKEQVFEDEFLHEKSIQVSIFMSPWDVHLNKVPISGKLSYYRYHPGKYWAAYQPKSSELNERNSIGIENTHLGKFLFRQIAGVVARRIKFYHQKGDYLEKGDELGFIKFGSRMDLFIPLDFSIKVELGDQVYGGETLIAKP